jgi:tetratricopeptide (TPR) repeat protein
MSRLPKSKELKIYDSLKAWRVSLWLILLSGTLSFWPFCADTTLVPRFFMLSAALLVSLFLLWNDLKKHRDTRWHLFDLALLGWCLLNWIAVSWSLSWSEGVFYAQKPLLLFGVYWLIRQALHRDEDRARRELKRITLIVTLVVFVVLYFQIYIALREGGLDNETLYQFASGISGNKSLAAEFLFFLLVLNWLFVWPATNLRQKTLILALTFGLLSLLIFILQVRTAMLAWTVGALVYCLVRAFFETGFRITFLKKLLPAGMLGIGLLLGLLLWKGKGNSAIERLNPLNYLESATANERRFIWYKTDLLNADHYWLGVGNGAWKFWMPSKNIGEGYRLAEGNVVFTRAHNDYLEIRSEMGMLGVLWFCGLFGMAFLMAMRALKRPEGLDHEVLVAAVGILGYCIVQYFDFPRERIDFQVVLGVLFAILAHKSKQWSIAPAFNFQFGALALLLGLAFNLIIGWQRIRGETHLVRLMEAQAKSDWKRVASESKKAEKPFHEYTDAAMPIAWHEGVALFQLGQFDKSAQAFERAYQLNPWSFQVINNYASALVKLKRYPEAIPLFEKALTINPRYDEGKFNLAFVHYQLNDLDQSRAWLSKVDTIANPNNPVDREKNQVTNKRLLEFQKVISEKQK